MEDMILAIQQLEPLANKVGCTLCTTPYGIDVRMQGSGDLVFDTDSPEDLQLFLREQIELLHGKGSLAR